MHTFTENPAATAQRNYDRALPNESRDYFRADELGHDPIDIDFREVGPRNGSRYHVTESQIEKFIVDLVTAPNRDIFLENTVGALPRAASNELAIHVAIARQWVKNKEAVGDIVGPAFWTWAKQATLAAVAGGWSAEDCAVSA